MRWEAIEIWLNAEDTKCADNRVLFAIGCIKADFLSFLSFVGSDAERQVMN